MEAEGERPFAAITFWRIAAAAGNSFLASAKKTPLFNIRGVHALFVLASSFAPSSTGCCTIHPWPETTAECRSVPKRELEDQTNRRPSVIDEKEILRIPTMRAGWLGDLAAPLFEKFAFHRCFR
jgi:hypothetical protein